MKLDVDLTPLELAVAKMQGIDGYLSVLKRMETPYEEAIALSKRYAVQHGGEIIEDAQSNTTALTLFNVQAYCFETNEGRFDFTIK